MQNLQALESFLAIPTILKNIALPHLRSFRKALLLQGIIPFPYDID